MNIVENKKYVYKYNHHGKDIYYYVDDVEGDMFVSDINDARIFTGKQIKYLKLDNIFNLLDEIYYEEDGEYIQIIEKPILIEV